MPNSSNSGSVGAITAADVPRSSSLKTMPAPPRTTKETTGAPTSARKLFAARNTQRKADGGERQAVPGTRSSSIGASPTQPTRGPSTNAPSSSRGRSTPPTQDVLGRKSSRSGSQYAPSSSPIASFTRQHQRSQSMRSQASTTDGASSSGRDSLLYRKTSSKATTMDGSDSIGSLNRSRSSSSTIPTSPDTEPVVVISKPASQADLLPAATIEQSNNRQAPPRPPVRGSKVASLQHRNKPLPVPRPEDFSRASHEDVEALRPPPLDTSPSPTGASAGSASSSPNSPAPPKSPTSSSRSTLRSALISGGKYLKTTNLWGQQSSRHPHTAASHASSASDAGSHSPRASPAASTANVSELDESAASIGKDPVPPPRSHSPFLFKRMSKANLQGAAASKEKPEGDAALPNASSSYFALKRTTRSRQNTASRADVDVPPVAPALALDAPAASDEIAPAAASTASAAPALPPTFTRSPPSMDLLTFMTPPESPPMPATRPPLTRTRSKSVGDVREILAGSALALNECEETLLPSTSAGGQPGEWFHLPPIETSHQSFMGSALDRTASSRRAPSSFRWSRVLGKRASLSEKSASGKDSDGASVPSSSPSKPSRLSMDRRQAVTSPRPSTVSKQSSKTVKNDSRPSIEPLSPRRASEASARSSETSSPNARRSSRKSIVESTQMYVPPQGRARASSISSKGSASTKQLGASMRKASSGSQGNPASPLSPNLAQLWSTAVRMGEPVDDIEGGEDSIEEIERMLPSPVPHESALLSASPDEVVSVDDSAAIVSRRPSLTEAVVDGDFSPPLRKASDLSEGGASRRKLSSRSSFGRTLATVFDPRPSVANHLEYPPPPSPSSSVAQMPSRPTSSMSGLITRRLSGTPRRGRPPAESISTPTRASGASPAARSTSSAKTPSKAQAAVSLDSTPTVLSAAKRSTFGRRSLDLLSNAPTPSRKADAKSGTETTTASADSPASASGAAPSASQRARRNAGAAATGAPPAVPQRIPEAAKEKRSAPPAVISSANATPLGGARTRKRSLPLLPAKKATPEKSASSEQRAIPPRSSSQLGFKTKASSSARQDAATVAKKLVTSTSTSRNAAAAASAPSTSRSGALPTALKIDTSIASMPRQRMPRPSSSLGVYGMDNDAPLMRQLNRPQVQDMDDHAFLEMLEGARRQHNEKAAKEAEKAERMTRMAQLGMATGHKTPRDASGGSASSRGKEGAANAAGAAKSSAGVGGGEATSSRGRTMSNTRPAVSRRPSSADARLGGKTLAEVRDELRGATKGEAGSPSKDGTGLGEEEGSSTGQAPSSASTRPAPGSSALVEATIGHASGHAQAHDAFANDDDWKREVRALFIIRELLATEKSYARHLESLLQAVRKKAIAPSSSSAAVPSPSTPVSAGSGSGASGTNGSLMPRRKSITGLSGVTATASAALTVKTASSSSSASSSSPSTPQALDRHLPLMRNLLPQLIALSRALSSRIDANPTALGVGAAFAIVAPQLEATFVAWSSAANEIMAGLRYAQGPKGKAKDRLVLTLTPADAGEAHGIVTGATSPTSTKVSHRFSKSLDALALTRPSSPEPRGAASTSNGPRKSADFPAPSLTAVASDADLGGDSSTSTKRLSKRRSTISSVHPRNLTKSKASAAAPITTSTANALSVDGPSVSRKGSTEALGGRRASGTVATGPPPSPSSSKATAVAASQDAPPAPPSRSASPWGFASTRRSLAAAASKRLSSSMSAMDISSAFTADQQSLNGVVAATATPAPSTIGAGPSAKALSPLDVAIMPMQRPPRYLLLLAELVRNTPPSSLSHARVARSLEAMRGIATKCDVAATTTVPASAGKGGAATSVSSRATTPAPGASPTAGRKTAPATPYK